MKEINTFFTGEEIKELSEYDNDIIRVLKNWIDIVDNEIIKNPYAFELDDYWLNLYHRQLIERFMKESQNIYEALRNKFFDLVKEYDKRFFDNTIEINISILTLKYSEIDWITRRIPKFPGDYFFGVLKAEYPDLNIN